MAGTRAALGAVALAAVAAVLVSGGSGTDRRAPEHIEVVPASRAALRWVARARPLGAAAPPWARRMYRRSLLVLRALTYRDGAAIAGARQGWAYVWPRDAGAVTLAFAASGYRAEARRVARFLLRLDLGAAARFYPDGTPVPGRGPQGDAAGWVTAAAQAAGLPAPPPGGFDWRNRPDYQEGEAGNYLANAIASTTPPFATSPRWKILQPELLSPAYGGKSFRLKDFPPGDGRGMVAAFGTRRGLVREAGNPGSGLDSAAAWAVRPFPHPALFPLVRRTLLRLAARSGRFGIVPSEDWDGGEDPWTAPTAWTAWSLAALWQIDRRTEQRGAAAEPRRFRGTALRERRAALRLMADLRRTATPLGLLPERVDAGTGAPTSTTPLAWSHAFAILALRELWPTHTHSAVPYVD